MSKNIVSLFLNASKKHPANIAIIEKNAQISFADLEQQVIKRAAYFLEHGIQKGDKVFVFVPMSIDLYINVLALFYIGAIAVFIDEWVSLKRLELCAALTKSKAFVGGWKVKLITWFSKELRSIPIKLSIQGIIHNQPALAEVTENDIALITFTTGSTGTPKGAIRTHELLLGQFNALKPLLDEQDDVVDMPMLPIVLLLNLAIGRTSVIADTKFTKPKKFQAGAIHNQIIAYNIKRITCSPYYAKALALYYKQHGITSGLQKMLVGGAPVFPVDANLICNNLCKNALVLYGSTEAEPIAHIAMHKLANEYSSLQEGLAVGNIHNNTKLAIVSYKDDIVSYDYFLKNQNPTGISGEIIVAGPHVLKAYINNEGAIQRNKIITYNNMVWHRTGDMGLIDKTGMLRLLGRCQQVIAYNDTTIYPFIIEAALLEIEGVTMGTIIKKDAMLIVVIEAEGDKQNIMNAITTLLLKYNIQQAQTYFVKTIPRDPRHHSKIDYGALEKILG
jgi:olefin beta-lactone synthetase